MADRFTNFKIYKDLSKVLTDPTKKLIIKDISECKRVIENAIDKTKRYTDAQLVSYGLKKRYGSNLRKGQRVKLKEVTNLYMDVYNAIMLTREFFTGANIEYTGAILEDNTQKVTGTFTVSREEFFNSMSFSKGKGKEAKDIILKTTKPLADFKGKIKQVVNSETIDTRIEAFSGNKQKVYDTFDKIVRERVGNYEGIGGWIFEGFQRMYFTSKIKNDIQQTKFLLNIESGRIKDEKYNYENYKDYITNLIRSIQSAPVKGFQAGDVNNQQLKKGKASLVSSTYLIATLDKLLNIFNNLEQGLGTEAEKGLQEIFTANIQAGEFIDQAEVVRDQASKRHIKEVIKSIDGVTFKES